MSTIATYTLQVVRPVEGRGRSPHTYVSDEDKRVLANLPAYVETWQEDMSDLLPEGYSVEIREWHDAGQL